MVRPATARLPVIMSVRPSQRWHTTAARPRLKPLRHRLRRHQNRNTAGVSDHLKLRRPPFRHPLPRANDNSRIDEYAKPVAGDCNGNGGRRRGRVIWHQAADSQQKNRLPPSPRSSPPSITDQQGPEAGIAKKSGDDANQDCHHGLGVLSTGTTIGLAAVVITVVPVLIIYLIFQRQLQGSVSAGTNK
jgi:hypothetical protein